MIISIDDVRKCNDLFESVNLSKVWIFGSVARNENHLNSDIDLIFDFDLNEISVLKMYGLKSKLSERLGCKIDILTMSQIHDALKMNTNSLEYQLAYHANQDKILIYDNS